MYELDNDPVVRYWQMNPETDDLLFSGLELRNGMVVLGDVSVRTELVDNPIEGELYNILQRNRWCRVSNVICNSAMVGFTATYADGTKLKMEMPLRVSWYVKKASLDDVDKLAGAKYRQNVIAGEYAERPNADGTKSIFIREAETGDLTEFIIGGYTNRDVPIKKTEPILKVKTHETFTDLVDPSIPVVDPKAPFFEQDEITPKSPDWHLKNLQPGTKENPFKWLREDPNPTRIDIPVYTEPPTQEGVVVMSDPTEPPQDSAGEPLPMSQQSEAPEQGEE